MCALFVGSGPRSSASTPADAAKTGTARSTSRRKCRRLAPKLSIATRNSTAFDFLSAASCRPAVDYILGRVCISVELDVINFCKQDISKTHLEIFEKFISNTPCILGMVSFG